MADGGSADRRAAGPICGLVLPRPGRPTTRERDRCHRAPAAPRTHPRLPGSPRVDLDQQAATQSHAANNCSPKERGHGLTPPTPHNPVRSGPALGRGRGGGCGHGRLHRASRHYRPCGALRSTALAVRRRVPQRDEPLRSDPARTKAPRFLISNQVLKAAVGSTGGSGVFVGGA
jgi:hypothetical protein